jgi:hypothetical protein
MLGAIQRRITELYDVQIGAEVEDFLCDEEFARALGGDEAARRGEVLFVVEQADGARVALFLDAAAREADEGGWLAGPERFRACCLAAEGVSHFVYVAFRADHALAVSELELELQAEIDKWVLGLIAAFPDGLGSVLATGVAATLAAGQGIGLVALRDRSRRLRARLFSEAAFLDEAGTERGDRYRAAHRLAARYAERLERRFVATGQFDGLARELRRFYRLGLREKLERIR